MAVTTEDVLFTDELENIDSAENPEVRTDQTAARPMEPRKPKSALADTDEEEDDEDEDDDLADEDEIDEDEDDEDEDDDDLDDDELDGDDEVLDPKIPPKGTGKQ